MLDDYALQDMIIVYRMIDSVQTWKSRTIPLFYDQLLIKHIFSHLSCQLLDIGAGDEEEHAVMLYNMLYYLALRDSG